MIISALVDYYKRLEADSEVQVPRFGWSRQKIGFIVTLNPDGSLHSIDSPPGEDDKARKKFTLVVPGQAKPPGNGINPCFLWDNASYMLGQVPALKKGSPARSPEWAWTRFEGFRARHLEQESALSDSSYATICQHLRSWTKKSLAALEEKAGKLAGFGVFRIRSMREYAHERDSIARFWQEQPRKTKHAILTGPSLLSGQVQNLARLNEPKIKGAGGQPAGTLLVSFDKKAFSSYGKDQGYNSPLGEKEAFAYCTGLNHLLADNGRRVWLGDTTMVFWSAKPHPIEDITGFMLGGMEDTVQIRKVEAFILAARRGAPIPLEDSGETPFYLLGLSANASRLAIRFWSEGTAGTIAERLAEHATALELDGAPENYKFPSIRRLTGETVMLKNGFPDDSRVSPVLAGELARSILNGTAYPRTLLTSVVRRIRIEGFVDQDTNNSCRAAMHRRASIIKACLSRSSTSTTYEVPMSLNLDHPETAYQLGRLFAALEKTQEDLPGSSPNSTIRKKFMGSASATPSVIFPRLLTLHQHHLAKLEHPGQRVKRDKLIGEICGRFASFPTHLSLEAQGLFFLGYYQQRQDLYTSKKVALETANA